MRTALCATCLVMHGCAAPQIPSRPTEIAQDRAQIVRLAQDAASRFGIESSLILGVIHVESSFRVDARSSVGARGLMQLMPRTARALAKKLNWSNHNITDPEFNIMAGSAYLAYLVDYFDGSRSLALAAYNAGPARVAGWVRNGTPLPGYSRRYVKNVLAAAESFRDTNFVIKKKAPEPDQGALRQLIRAKLGSGQTPFDPEQESAEATIAIPHPNGG